ncbi:unnamed protein product, partial [Rotaria sp. Silwood2]
NPCGFQSCRNGGTCQVAMNGYICLCPAYYVGVNCEYINPCVLIGAPSSCQSLLTPSGNYTCSCPTNPLCLTKYSCEKINIYKYPSVQ